MPRLFTPDEDAYLVAHYSNTTLVEMARHLGRHWKIIQQHIELLIRRRQLRRADRYYQHPWTSEDEDWLSDHWGILSDEVVARYLRRTVIACELRAHRFVKVSRKMAFWTSRDVASLFGVDSHRVVHWIEDGWLPAKRATVSCGGNVMWHITDEAIQQFIRCHPAHYDRTRMEPDSWYRRLAEKVWAKDPWLTVVEAARELGCHPHTLSRHCARGWLRAVRIREAGKSGGWRIPRSALATFRLRQSVRPCSPALAAHYRHQRKAAGGSL